MLSAGTLDYKKANGKSVCAGHKCVGGNGGKTIFLNVGTRRS
jgi:hypothetical protein